MGGEGAFPFAQFEKLTLKCKEVSVFLLRRFDLSTRRFPRLAGFNRSSEGDCHVAIKGNRALLNKETARSSWDSRVHTSESVKRPSPSRTK